MNIQILDQGISTGRDRLIIGDLGRVVDGGRHDGRSPQGRSKASMVRLRRRCEVGDDADELSSTHTPNLMAAEW